MEQIHQYTIKLIRYVLNGDIPQLPEGIDFEAIFAFSKSHGIENMVYVGLKDCKVPVPEPVMSKFRQEYEKAIMSEAVQAIELENLSLQFEESGIDHIPLKGSVIKYMYPMPDYRKSGDIDILIKPCDEAKAVDVLAANAYKLADAGDAHDIHISYCKPPMLLIELHRALVRSKNRAYDFCNSVWENAIQCENSKHRYEMPDEFMYVYLVAHLAKHLYSGGGGIRLITDIYLANSKLNFDGDKLDMFLKKAQLTDINEMVLKLADRWFNGSENADMNIDLLENIVLTGGSFGSTDTKKLIDSNISYKTKLNKFIHMIFPSERALLDKYPVLKKYPVLLPLIWVYRWFKLLLFKRKSVISDIKDNFDTEEKDAKYNEILNAVCDK